MALHDVDRQNRTVAAHFSNNRVKSEQLLHPSGSLAGLPTIRAEAFQQTGADEHEPD